MPLNLSNFLLSKKEKSKMADFQDLDHIDGVSVSTTSANLYNNDRDDLVLFYFRHGAEHASVYTQSQVVSENIKWNKKLKTKKIRALLVNTRNANALTGKKGYEALEEISEEISTNLTKKQKDDEDHPKKIKPNEVLFGKSLSLILVTSFSRELIFSRIFLNLASSISLLLLNILLIKLNGFNIFF